MGVVGSLVHRASQVNHPAPGRLGNSVGRPAAPVAMGKGCRAVFPVIRQYAPGVARAHSHQCSRLIQCHVLCQQAVQNLESRLFLGSQSHILHEMSVTFMLASYRGRFRWTSTPGAEESCTTCPMTWGRRQVE